MLESGESFRSALSSSQSSFSPCTSHKMSAIPRHGKRQPTESPSSFHRTQARASMMLPAESPKRSLPPRYSSLKKGPRLRLAIMFIPSSTSPPLMKTASESSHVFSKERRSNRRTVGASLTTPDPDLAKWPLTQPRKLRSSLLAAPTYAIEGEALPQFSNTARSIGSDPLRLLPGSPAIRNIGFRLLMGSPQGNHGYRSRSWLWSVGI